MRRRSLQKKVTAIFNMRVKKWVTHSPEETMTLAGKIAKQIKPGTVIALCGNLGSGKTTFLKGFTAGLGLQDKDAVTSPTFSILHIYDCSPKVYHFDLYRLESEKEILNIGFEELIEDIDAIKCIEWAEKAPGLMPQEMMRVQFETVGENERKIQIF